LVELPRPLGDVRELRAGDRLVFGRGSPGCQVDVTLDHPGVSRVAGEIHAVGNYWHLTNCSARSTYLVQNVESLPEHLSVGPGRADVPIPFEISGLILPAGADTLTLTIYATAQPVVAVQQSPEQGGTMTQAAFPLDRGAKYFLVLVALCEPLLRGWTEALPTTTQIAERLRPLPGCEAITPRAVDFHIEYVARHKLRLGGRSVGGSPRRAAVGGNEGFAARRTALVEFSLRFGLVCTDDVALLPPRAAGHA
jgi:hypothetical protein